MTQSPIKDLNFNYKNFGIIFNVVIRIPTNCDSIKRYGYSSCTANVGTATNPINDTTENGTENGSTNTTAVHEPATTAIFINEDYNSEYFLFITKSYKFHGVENNRLLVTTSSKISSQIVHVKKDYYKNYIKNI